MIDLKVPKFASEAEETEWWVAHEDELAHEFEAAVAEGRLDADDPAVPFVSLSLDPEDIAKARLQAAERGLRYQTYLKMIIHEALRNAENSQKSSAR